MCLEGKPSSAMAVGPIVDIMGFANNERHINAIAKEFELDVEELPNGDLFVGVEFPGTRLRFYLCNSPKDGK